MRKHKLRNFNWGIYIASPDSYRVTTRDNRPVTEIVRFEGIEFKYKIYGVVDKHVVSWDDEGRSMLGYMSDLYLQWDDDTGDQWVKVYMDRGANLYSSPQYTNEMDAKAFKPDMQETLEVAVINLRYHNLNEIQNETN